VRVKPARESRMKNVVEKDRRVEEKKRKNRFSSPFPSLASRGERLAPPLAPPPRSLLSATGSAQDSSRPSLKSLALHFSRKERKQTAEVFTHERGKSGTAQKTENSPLPPPAVQQAPGAQEEPEHGSRGQGGLTHVPDLVDSGDLRVFRRGGRKRKREGEGEFFTFFLHSFSQLVVFVGGFPRFSSLPSPFLTLYRKASYVP